MKQEIKEIEQEEILKTFIRDNELTFSDTGSGLNSECCIIAGFADHIGVENYGPIISAINSECLEASDYQAELERVVEYAWENNYGNFWNTPEAKKQYKF
jgi:hypothetical protein